MCWAMIRRWEYCPRKILLEDRITSLQDFSDYYETMLDQYEQLAAEYDLGDDLKAAFEKLLNQETWDKIKSVLGLPALHAHRKPRL